MTSEVAEAGKLSFMCVFSRGDTITIHLWAHSKKGFKEDSGKVVFPRCPRDICRFSTLILTCPVVCRETPPRWGQYLEGQGRATDMLSARAVALLVLHISFPYPANLFFPTASPISYPSPLCTVHPCSQKCNCTPLQLRHLQAKSLKQPRLLWSRTLFGA